MYKLVCSNRILVILDIMIWTLLAVVKPPHYVLCLYSDQPYH